MANKVTIQVLGGQPKVVDGVVSVADAISALGLEGQYTATINGEPASLDSDVMDFEYIALAPAVKGGLI
jgi:sulfur carrier protein ThiS